MRTSLLPADFRTVWSSLPSRPLAVLALLFGGVMPIVAAICFPTYMHQMPKPWWEWARLLEFPFVAAEIIVIQWARARGIRDLALLKELPRDVQCAALLLVVGLFTSSLMFSHTPAVSFLISLFTLIHLRFGMVVYEVARLKQTDDLEHILGWFIAGLLPLALLTAWRFNFPPPATSVPGGVIEWGSALPGFINVRHFGSWTGAVAAAALAQLLFARNPAWFGWRQAAYLFAAALTVWSGTRGAIMGIAVAMAAIAILNRKLPTFRAVGVTATLTGGACIAAWLLVPEGHGDFLLWSIGDIADANVASGGRLALWTATMTKWLASPLFGWGSGSTFWEVNVGWAHTQPHNVILQFLISWGIVGAAGGLWLLGRATCAVAGFAARQRRLQPLLALLICLLSMSFIEGMLHYPRFIEPIVAVFAILLAEREQECGRSGVSRTKLQVVQPC